MFTEVFPQVSASPSLIWVVAAIGLHLVNTFLGLYMVFRRKTPRLIRIHLMVFAGVLVSLAMFLILNGVHGENTVWDYAIAIYFITLLPLSAKWDVTVHGVAAVTGLTLLPVLILLQM
ncbi:MAG: hypothetical protein ACE5ER_00010 [Nitrospinaceae bacterium]